ncbi:MAG: RNA pseudouridine synthase [Xanthobacteraceae bacterium]
MLAKPFNPKAATEDEILARVLYRDGLMLVIDKPAGISVHRGPKGGPSLEDWFPHLRYGLPRDPELAHRLDRETSGCLVLGRHRKALAHLSLLFKHRKVGKTYWAVVEGGPAEDEGTIDMPLGKLDPHFGWWMKPDPHGAPAMTKWKVMGRGFAPVSPPTAPWRGEVDRPKAARVGVTSQASPHSGGFAADPPPPGEGVRARGEANAQQLTWLSLEPVTGRTHQLRVHCAAMGFPIFGDDIYGNEASQRRARQIKFVPRPDAPGLQLHAREVVVPISKNKEPVRVIAPVPPHLHERLAACGWNGESLSAG